MDPDQMAQLQQLRGRYGQSGGFQPTQGTQFGQFQVPQHAPLAGPSLGGGQGGGGGAGGGGGGGMMEGAQKLISGLMANKGTRPAAGQQPAGAPGVGAPGPGPAGPQIVGSQREMGPFMSEMSPPPGGGAPGVMPSAAPTGAAPPPQQPPGYNAVPPPMTGPLSDRALPAAVPPQMQGAGMPQLQRAGMETPQLPDWLFRMPRMTGAMGL